MPTGDRAGVASADTIALALADARDDDSIDTIVVRVDSPGGSPSASETIRRGILRAQEEGKKVYISMGNLAASGGYWVSADADMIFAQDTTLTGSIGVVMGKFEASALWDKVGANWDAVSFGDSASLWSLNEPFSKSQLDTLNILIDDTYQAFLERVAHGRDMSMEEVREIAKGRVWSGRDARERGLVDHSGGLYDTLNYIAWEKELEGAEALNVVVLPKPKTRVEQLIELFGIQASVSTQYTKFADVLNRFDGAIAQYDQVKNPQNYLVYNSDLDMLQ